MVQAIRHPAYSRNSPDVTNLLERNPFPKTPPRYIRAILYDYHSPPSPSAPLPARGGNAKSAAFICRAFRWNDGVEAGCARPQNFKGRSDTPATTSGPADFARGCSGLFIGLSLVGRTRLQFYDRNIGAVD